MKKFITYICLPLLLAGCELGKEDNQPDVSQKGTPLIQADIEGLLRGEDERVWPEGAYVGVFGSESGINEKYVLKRAGAGLASAEFYGPLVSGETIAAYYPWSDTFTGRAGAMPAKLTANQEYADTGAVAIFQKYCPTAFAGMKDGRMKFSYPFGLLRVRVELFESLKVLRMSFSASDRAVAGSGVILPDGSLKVEGGGLKTVELDCGEGVSTIKGDGFADFYLTLFPGEYAEAALIIYAEGEDPIVCTLRNFEIPRIDSGSFALANIAVKSNDPQGFIVNEQVFD